MSNQKKKLARRQRIKMGIRSTIKGTPEKPRLTVFRSNKEIYAQIIDDIKGETLISASSLQSDINKEGKTNKEIASLIGKQIGERAKAAKITKVVFDRNGFLYHGSIQALADGARESGLEF